MRARNIRSGYFAGSQLVNIEEQAFAIFDGSLRPVRYLPHEVRYQAMGFLVRVVNGGRVRSFCQAVNFSLSLIYPVLDEVHTVAVLGGEILLMSTGDGVKGHLAGLQVVNIEEE